MITGASTADAAIILVDVQNGLMTQTKRHSYICSLMGIKNIILAINKMDLIHYKENDYQKIVDDYKKLVSNFGFKKIISIPISALNGENIVNESKKMPWYKGKSIFNTLENIKIKSDTKKEKLRLPIQWVNRASSDFRGFSGSIVSGKIKTGDGVNILPHGTRAKIKDLIVSGKKSQVSFKNTAGNIIAGNTADGT